MITYLNRYFLGILTFILCHITQTSSADTSACIDAGELDIKAGWTQSLSKGDLITVNMKLQNFPEDGSLYNTVEDLCQRLIFTDKHGKQLESFVSSCSYHIVQTWLKYTDSDKVFLKLCPSVKSKQNNKIFDLLVEPETLTPSDWILQDEGVQLYPEDDLVVVDTSPTNSGSGSATLVFPKIYPQKNNPIIEVEYRFKNFKDFGRLHQERLIVGQHSDSGSKIVEFSNILHPIIGNPGKFVIWDNREVKPRYSWLGNMEIDTFYRVIFQLNFQTKKINYYIFDDNYRQLYHKADVSFMGLTRSEDPSYINLLSVGDHCADSGFSGYSFIAIRTSPRKFVGYSLNSPYFHSLTPFVFSE